MDVEMARGHFQSWGISGAVLAVFSYSSNVEQSWALWRTSIRIQ